MQVSNVIDVFEAEVAELRRELAVYEMGWREELGTVSDVQRIQVDIAEYERCIVMRRKRLLSA
jgi:hypothetical protein